MDRENQQKLKDKEKRLEDLKQRMSEKGIDEKQDATESNDPRVSVPKDLEFEMGLAE